jgi:hypothetical protein
MDLNYILFRHQLLLVAAADPAARPDERGRAAARADRISCAVEAWRSERIEGARIPLPRSFQARNLSPLSSLSTGGLR